MKAVIVSIGDELVLGQVVDRNAGWLSCELAGMGIVVSGHVTVGDEVGAIGRELGRAGEDVEVVIVTGGLGPTEDDLTRQAVEVIPVVLVDVDHPRRGEKQSVLHGRQSRQLGAVRISRNPRREGSIRTTSLHQENLEGVADEASDRLLGARPSHVPRRGNHGRRIEAGDDSPHSCDECG